MSNPSTRLYKYSTYDGKVSKGEQNNISPNAMKKKLFSYLGGIMIYLPLMYPCILFKNRVLNPPGTPLFKKEVVFPLCLNTALCPGRNPNPPWLPSI